MASAWAIVGWTGFGLALAAGLALDLVGLFGNWVILAAVAVAWLATGFSHFSGWVLLAMTGLAALGEVVEVLAAGYGAARFGGSRGVTVAAVAGGLAGAVVGAPWFPVVGVLLGACAGAFLGAAAYELLLMRREPGEALRSGLGAAVGRVAGLFAKLLAGAAMLALAAFTF